MTADDPRHRAGAAAPRHLADTTAPRHRARPAPPRHQVRRHADRRHGAAAGRHVYVPHHRSPVAPRRRVVVVATLIVGVAVGAAVVLPTRGSDGRTGTPAAAVAGADELDGGGDRAAPTTVPAVDRLNGPTGADALAASAPSDPVEVEIPAISVRASLVDLRLAEDGALEAPDDFDVAGWFVDGPQPGQPGPAVVAGHVDSQEGPAVFYRLHELETGDEVLVHREDGSTVTFAVRDVEQHPKDAFPAEAVYGPVPGPELRLITCGGLFDEDADSYRDNIVVYAAAG